MSSMKAVRIHEYGSVERLTLEDVPRPVAGEGELLIRVHATSVNPFDCAVRAGYLAGWYAYSFPFVLGLDVSGVVEQVGEGVSGFAPGDEVYARADPARGGAYADYVAIAATDAAPKPRSLDHLHAAALPHVGLTAWRALVDAAALSTGQNVLIHGAAGGVGSVAVQLAKQCGAMVIGTASSRNLEFLRALGADEVVDYPAVRFEEAVQDIDVVFDTVGGDTQARSWSVLKPGGVLVSIVQPPSEEAAAEHGVRQHFVAAHPPAGDVLRQLASAVEAGHVRPVIASVIPLRDIQKAHTLVEGRHTCGKIVLSVVE